MSKFDIETIATYAAASAIAFVSTVMLFAATAVPSVNQISGMVA